jgi:hypothetical protein
MDILLVSVCAGFSRVSQKSGIFHQKVGKAPREQEQERPALLSGAFVSSLGFLKRPVDRLSFLVLGIVLSLGRAVAAAAAVAVLLVGKR